MADQRAYPSLEALRKLEKSLNVHLRDQDASPRIATGPRATPEGEAARRPRGSPQQRLAKNSSAKNPIANNSSAKNSSAKNSGAKNSSAKNSSAKSSRSKNSRISIAQLFTPEWRMPLLSLWPRVRKLVFVGGALGTVALLTMVALW